MKRLLVFFISSVLFLSGCTVRSYSLTRDRVDQDLTSGNRGFLKGTPDTSLEKERSSTRTTRVVEIEIGSPVRFKKSARKAVKTKVDSKKNITEDTISGNKGYITSPEIKEDVIAPQMEKYIVQKNDTLQKISQRFYGTTKKWKKIYDANSQGLKGPDKIYPGQVIYIPKEALKEPTEKLK